MSREPVTGGTLDLARLGGGERDKPNSDAAWGQPAVPGTRTLDSTAPIHVHSELLNVTYLQKKVFADLFS